MAPKLSEEQFVRFLAWLDPDPVRAAEKYEFIRRELIEFFGSRGFDDEAEELVEETIDRVASRVSERVVIDIGAALQLCHNVAYLVSLHHQDQRLAGRPSWGGTIDPPEAAGGSGGAGLESLENFRDPEVPRVPPNDTARRAKSVKKTQRLRSRVVSTGFSSLDQPDVPVDPRTILQAATSYYFWFEIGKPQKGSIETTPMDIPAVPANTVLAVVLFSFKDTGLEISSDADVGFVEVQSSGAVRVIRQPQNRENVDSSLLERRLFFPVRTPAKAGVCRMRCNIYAGQTLLQSRLVEVRVTTSQSKTTGKENALRSVVDYKISRQLDPAHLNSFKDHRLSVLLNKNEDGSHSFHFYGADDQLTFKQDDVRFGEGELDGMLAQARGTLRLASWNDAAEWRPGVEYKYKDRKPDLNRLKNDLLNLAKWGYEFYTQIRARVAGGEAAVDKFEQLLLRPGNIQFAMKESPRYVLPAALIYDYPFDTGAEEYSLCPNFLHAFNTADSLDDLECLTGNCPAREDLTTVCPSGFWGFRHYIGLPLSIHNAPDVPAHILVHGNLKMAVGVATDLQLHKTHLASLQKLKSKLTWNDAGDRSRVFQLLKDSPHLVYFYCHGGLIRDAPFLQIGPKEKPSRIQRSNFYAYKIVWDEPRPLVFINGCHTTAVAPTQALEFITPLVTYSRCAGVIGTEITIFEELATVFAEDCIGRFFRGEPIGMAVRNARLKLLKEGNPLGLVYIPFVMSGLTLVDATPVN